MTFLFTHKIFYSLVYKNDSLKFLKLLEIGFLIDDNYFTTNCGTYRLS